MENENKNIINELEVLEAEKLKALKQKMQSVPESFYEEMQTKVLSKITIEEKTKIPKAKVFRIKIVGMAIAASLILMLAIILNTNKKNSDFWATVSVLDLENYLAENIDDFSEEEIASISKFNDFSILSYSEMPEDVLQDFLLNTPITEDELY